MRGAIRHLARLGLTLLTTLMLASPPVQSQDPVQIHFGQWGPIQYDLDRSDVRIATEQWVRQATANWDRPIDFSVRYFESLDAIAMAIARGELDVVHLDTVTFLTQGARLGPLEPAAISGGSGRGALRRHVLLVRKESPYRSLPDLLGKRLAAASLPGTRTIEEAWMDSELHRAGLPGRTEFFAQILRKRTFPKAILNVFFGQVDCALVPLTTFKVMGELNPQVLEQMRPLLTSPPLLPHLTAFTPSCEEEKKRIILEGAEAMHEYQEGRQILALFGDERMIRCEPRHLESARRVLMIDGGLTGP